MNNTILEDINIEKLTHEIRGMQVILDSELAKAYNMETKVLNQIVKRNINRFQEYDIFKLTNEEYLDLKSQIVTSNINTRGGRRTSPYAFTKSGIETISNLIKGEKNSETTKKIIEILKNKDDNKSTIISNENIEKKIYEIRGKQVMLDADLAKIYRCSNGTKTINLAVKRHINRFPERFMFRLTEEEYSNLKFQFETSRLEKEHGGRRYTPYAFTEQGTAMLATILRTPIAEKVSIQIMDAFITMRKYISNNLLEQKYINNQVIKNAEDIKLLQESFKKFEEKKKINEIYFQGQIYDAYSKIVDIFKNTKKELIIIDSYTDKTTLDMIKELECKVILITKNNNKLSKLDIEKYNQQYHNLSIIYNDTFHDRYFIIDRYLIYHCGTSINHAGSRTFSINILEDKIVKEALMNNIQDLIILYNT